MFVKSLFCLKNKICVCDMPAARKNVINKQKYRIRVFDWNYLRYDTTLGVFGQRGTGKTNFSRNVMLRNRLQRCFVICESPEIDHKYKDIPSAFRHPEFSEDFLKSFLRAQHRVAKQIMNKFDKYREEMKKLYKAKYEEEKQRLVNRLVEQAIANNWTNAEQTREGLKAS